MSDEVENKLRMRIQTKMQHQLASLIDRILNGDEKPGEICFVLLTCKFGAYQGGQVNFVSNGDRASVIAMMKEYIARSEGRYHSTGGNT
jgi:hypothetical protein